MGNFKGGPGFEQIQLMIDVRPATQDKESSVEISGALIGRCRKGGGGREREKGILPYPFRIFVDLSSPSPFFAAATQATWQPHNVLSSKHCERFEPRSHFISRLSVIVKDLQKVFRDPGLPLFEARDPGFPLFEAQD